MGCGVQNAVITKYSGGVIRSSHTTGLLADLGTNAGRIMRGYKHDAWQIRVLLPLLVAFVTGSVLGRQAFQAFGKLALLINVGFLLCCGLSYVVYLQRVTHTTLSLQQLLFGKYSYPAVVKLQSVTSNIVLKIRESATTDSAR
jgi:uncharacterized membrane protein YoaK (UPF0700 family)